MASPEQSANSSSLTGPSKECQKLEKASLISSDKCTKPRNSSDRMDQSQYTAGEEEKVARMNQKIEINEATPDLCACLQTLVRILIMMEV